MNVGQTIIVSQIYCVAIFLNKEQKSKYKKKQKNKKKTQPKT